MILDKKISVQRLTKDSDNTKKESYAINEALLCVSCNIQPASVESMALAEGVYGQMYDMYTAESGILSGDRVTVSGTAEQYVVKGRSDWSSPDLIPHYEYLIVEFEENEVF